MSGGSQLLRTRGIGSFVHQRSLYLILIPGIAYYLLFHYIPMGGLIIAFKKYNIFKGFIGSDWVGFEHFKNAFANTQFLVSLRNSILINLYKLVVNFPLPILTAVLLNEIGNRVFKRTAQTVLYFPFFLSWVVIAGIVINLLSPRPGS
jgi:putative aldouronate transport system permease protein